MFEFLLASQNLFFTIALGIMLMIALVEGVGAMMGAGLSSFIDQVFPEVDIDLGIEGPELDAPGSFGRFLSWIRVGQVPVLVVLVIFLLVFGVLGLVMQDLVHSFTGRLMPGLVAALLTFVLALPIVRGATNALAKVIPKDETSAVSRDSFIGRSAIITLGEAKRGYPTQAKVKDRYGKVHYLLVEPDNPEDTLKKDDWILLVKHDGVRFYAIRTDNPEMACFT